MIWAAENLPARCRYYHEERQYGTLAVHFIEALNTPPKDFARLISSISPILGNR